MNPVTLLAVAIALSMDAFAVAIVSGLTIPIITRRHLFRLSFHFGLFQAAMFLGGWYLGSAVRHLVERFDHWVAFVLLLLVGLNIIRESLHDKSDERETRVDPTSGWQLVILSVATSIDALAVGFSLAILDSSVFKAAIAIGVVAATFTIAGMMLGRQVGKVWGRRVEIFGGLILIAIGAKILSDHLMT
jgi:putative Mn2+ efflux pump MntP